MADTTVRSLYRTPPKQDLQGVQVSGWVRTMRESKSFAFVELSDGTFFKPCSWCWRRTGCPNTRA
jgi:asparaginyl-tRNA synthetase